MIPSFAVADRDSARVWIAPPYFRPLNGVPRNVTLAERTHKNPSAHHTQSGSVAKKRGLSYEERALTLLSGMFDRLMVQPSIHFFDDSGARRVIPDAILEYPSYYVLFEIKIRHTIDAYFQMEKYISRFCAV